MNGRHPLLSPPLRLTLTHAVRRPLGTASGQVRVERAAGDTMARISPAPPTDPPTDPTTPEQAIWGIDVPSTGSVAVRARWQEWSDAPEPVATSADVAQLHLPRGTEQLPEIPHDFGDTKHRQVTFDVTAISRFRDCFVDDDEELFTTTGPLQEVSVLSTARPPAPVVLSVVPAFSWRGEREAGSVLRQRLGGRLRVELARPWFTTGQGEALAVLVWPGTEDALPEGMRDQVTWCNRDPIHATTSPQALVTLAQCAGAEAILDVQDPASGTSIKALIYPVFFHEGHWYADVALPGVASSSYAPLVRLAVARAQPHSLVDDQVDLRLSSVVTADLTPVLPDRTLDIIRTNDTLQVRLSGLGRLAPSQGNRVFASLERRAGTVADAADGADLTSLGPSDPAFPAWVRVADGAVAGELGEDLPPLTLAAGTEHLRLVVREVEEMHSDVSALGVDAPDELADRTVFVDVVDLAGL